MIIDYVEIDGQRTQIGAGTTSFPDYFDIDSMRLLLGKNGAGKTRLLLNIAEVLTRGTPYRDQGHWTGTTPWGTVIRSDAKKPPTHYGVVYYTPLPYRRTIAAHRNFVDASTIKENIVRANMFKQFRAVSDALDVPRRLLICLSYPRSIIKTLVAPLILEVPCRLSDPRIERLRQSFIEPEEGVVQNGTVQEFTHTLATWLENELEQRGNTFRLASLATLSHQAQSLSLRASTVIAFLTHAGLARFEDSQTPKERQSRDKAKREFRVTFENTRRIFDLPYKSTPKETDAAIGIEFEASDISAFEELSHGNIAVNIGWENLSSGFLSIVQLFSRLEAAVNRLDRQKIKSVLLLIDEGDAYLHLEWQRLYIDYLNWFLARLKEQYRLDALQALISTHSPIISGDFPSEMITRLTGNISYGSVTLENLIVSGSSVNITSPDVGFVGNLGSNIKTFANSLDNLVYDAFETYSIGGFASRKIQQLRSKVVDGTLTEADTRLIDEIGDEGLRRAVLTKEVDTQS